MVGPFKKTLFISVASYKDTQLIPTIENALFQAKDPTRIYLAVVEQDDKSSLKEIKELTSSYGAGLYYEHFTPDRSYGVCWARNRVQKYLDASLHDYYLQIDSHTRFTFHYDSFLINGYEHAKDYWGNFVWTAPPPDYEYDFATKTSKLQTDRPHTVANGTLQDWHPSRIKSDVKQWSTNPYGDLVNHISAAQMFGCVQHFIDHPYDPKLYWEGEESTYGARLYCSNIKTVSPPRAYIYHLYDDGSRGTRKRPGDSRHVGLAAAGINRCNDFWVGKVEQPYGVASVEKLNEYLYATGREVAINEQ